MFDTLLIANRGEIARRIARTARRLGIKVVAVYSDADAHALHVKEADAAVRLGPASVSESYLRADAILEAAARTGASAIHPGYGFLSENADFAEAVGAAGLTFIGPSPASIRAMGRKDEAKAIMEAAGVPVTPGYRGDDQSLKTLKAAAGELGYPVLIKAVAGGGGKGMRKVDKAGDFAAALESAQREAAKAFGDDRVLIEKFITGPRHIEVQVFGDTHGNVVHFFERDCSLQRRHQKVIEEAPAPGMTEDVRAAMTHAAVEAARAVNYVNAGTVEFIVDGTGGGSGGLRPDGFFFMEMNTRLQVEHPVTEMITGQDLVELQLHVAAGGTLPDQGSIVMQGHAMEARIYAEDPDGGFLPSAGRLMAADWGALSFTEASLTDACETGARVDAAVGPGDMVSPFYDPMIAKVIVHGFNREEARERLRRHLAEDVLLAGPATNLGFLVRCLDELGFAAGTFDTGLIERAGDSLTMPSLRVKEAFAAAAMLDWAVGEDQRAALAKAVVAEGAGAREVWGETWPDPWSARDGFRVGAPARAIYALEHRGERITAHLTQTGRHAYDVQVAGRTLALSWQRNAADYPGMVLVDGHGGPASASAMAVSPPGHLLFAHEGDVWLFTPPDFDAAVEALEAGDDIKAPMPGKIVAVRASAGDTVAKGDALVILEAMKMEHTLAAPRDGVIEAVVVSQGDQVVEGASLARLVAEDAA